MCPVRCSPPSTASAAAGDVATVKPLRCTVYPPELFVEQGFDTPGKSTDPVGVAQAPYHLRSLL